MQKIVDLGQYPATVEATLDRVEALKGADAVLCTILASGVDVWRYDIEIPKKYGVDTNNDQVPDCWTPADNSDTCGVGQDFSKAFFT